MTNGVGANTGANVGNETHVLMGAAKEVTGVGDKGAHAVTEIGKAGAGAGALYVLTKAAWPVHVFVRVASLEKYDDERTEGDMQEGKQVSNGFAVVVK